MKRMLLVLGVLAFVGSTLGCGGVSKEDYQKELKEAATCSQGDTCVIGGGIDCVCAAPINESRVNELASMAEDVDCEGLAVDCAAGLNPRCENNTCVADPG